MIPLLKYTVARLVLLAGVFLILLPVPGLSLLIKAMVALLVSLVLSWFMLGRLREQTSVALAQLVERRRERKARLRAALAGEDSPSDPAPDEDDHPRSPN